MFELRTPRHLLDKALHDLGRLRDNHLNAYAAFDFFVTARHIPDWVYPHDASKRDALFAQHVELRICRHLADGAKHFFLNNPRHRQVQGTARRHDPWGGFWLSPWGLPRGADELMVELDHSDADTLALGREIRALNLAEKVCAVLEKVVEEKVA